MNAMKLGTGAIAAGLLFGVIGCSESSEASPTQASQSPAAQVSTSKAISDPKSEEALKRRANDFNTLTVAKNWDGAWAFYSQRCQAKVESADSLKSLAEIAMKGRNQQLDPNGVTVRVTGSSAQVVTVDNDPVRQPMQ